MICEHITLVCVRMYALLPVPSSNLLLIMKEQCVGVPIVTLSCVMRLIIHRQVKSWGKLALFISTID